VCKYLVFDARLSSAGLSADERSLLEDLRAPCYGLLHETMAALSSSPSIAGSALDKEDMAHACLGLLDAIPAAWREKAKADTNR
jgi:hypothetical protein